jgi:hypothetical protein
VFSQRQVKDLLRQYVLVQLYTDTVPPHFQPTTSAEENRTLMHTRFGTAQLPYYAVVAPEGNDFAIRATYEEGKINNVAEFMDFLRNNAQGK